MDSPLPPGGDTSDSDSDLCDPHEAIFNSDWIACYHPKCAYGGGGEMDMQDLYVCTKCYSEVTCSKCHETTTFKHKNYMKRYTYEDAMARR